MSLLQIAFVERSRVPDRARLEEVVRALGFDLQIDEFYRPFECSGFLPCVLKGKKSGFEIYFGSPEESFQSFPHLKWARAWKGPGSRARCGPCLFFSCLLQERA